MDCPTWHVGYIAPQIATDTRGPSNTLRAVPTQHTTTGRLRFQQASFQASLDMARLMHFVLDLHHELGAVCCRQSWFLQSNCTLQVCSRCWRTPEAPHKCRQPGLWPLTARGCQSRSHPWSPRLETRTLASGLGRWGPRRCFHAHSMYVRLRRRPTPSSIWERARPRT